MGAEIYPRSNCSQSCSFVLTLTSSSSAETPIVLQSEAIVLARHQSTFIYLPMADATTIYSMLQLRRASLLAFNLPSRAANISTMPLLQEQAVILPKILSLASEILQRQSCSRSISTFLRQAAVGIRRFICIPM